GSGRPIGAELWTDRLTSGSGTTDGKSRFLAGLSARLGMTTGFYVREISERTVCRSWLRLPHAQILHQRQYRPNHRQPSQNRQRRFVILRKKPENVPPVNKSQRRQNRVSNSPPQREGGQEFLLRVLHRPRR